MSIYVPKRRRDCLRRDRRKGAIGFTLIELIMVVVMLGVLAVVAAPRIFNSNDFNARGFHDETLALLRYAQKAAIAQRRTVCVTFTISSASLTMASAPATFDCASSVTLRGPTSDAASITGKPGVAYSAPPSAFNFDGLGQPMTSTGGGSKPTQTIQVNNAAKSITVETVTGYVHE